MGLGCAGPGKGCFTHLPLSVSAFIPVPKEAFAAFTNDLSLCFQGGPKRFRSVQPWSELSRAMVPISEGSGSARKDGSLRPSYTNHGANGVTAHGAAEPVLLG